MIRGAALAILLPLCGPAMGQPIPTELSALLVEANEVATAEFAALDTAYGVSQVAPRSALRDGQLTLTWSHPDGRTILANVEVIGSYSAAHGAFVWGWFNESVPDTLATASLAVRQFGQDHDIDELAEGRISFSPRLAGALAATATLIGDLDGMYVIPTSDTEQLFLGIRDIGEEASQ